MADTATSKPFMITLPSGTKLYGITVTDYIKDGNNVKPVDPNKGSPMYYYTEIPRDKWKGPSDFYIQYAAPGTGSPKFYQIQGVYNRNGDGKWAIEPGYGGAELQQEFAKYNAGKPTQVSTVVATSTKAVAKAANVPESGLSATLFKTNTGGDPPKPPEGAEQTTISKDDLTLKQIQGDVESTREWKGETYVYPTSVNSTGQDYIKFDVVNYVASQPSNSNATSLTRDVTKKERKASIVLPIQPSITDTNTVDWNGLGINPVELGLYGISNAAMTGTQEDVTNILNQLGTTVTQDQNVVKAITLYLKQRAIGVEGLLSRFAGAIVNPNLELLFQGPQLRPFNFTFRLSPRDSTEATQVRSIIRVFKEAMAPQVASSGLFLATPYVFDIKYVRGKYTENNVEQPIKDPHPSLNKIKTCALQACNVDYTPDGSYMTFNEANATMTSYNLTLQFQELEPITSKDYNGIPLNQIGY